MDLSVVSVGDGACSVAYGDDCRSHLIMDCGDGSRPSRQSEASQKLLYELALRKCCGGLPQNLLVTHFDLDHWGGLAQLPIQSTGAQSVGSSFGLQTPSEVTIYMPRFPGRAAMLGTMMMAVYLIDAALRQGPFFDLVDSWKSGGARVNVQPLSREDLFEGPDGPWTVYWPPRTTDDLTKTAGEALDRVLNEIAGIVSNSPLLRLAYAAARSSSLFASMQEDTILLTTEEAEREIELTPLGSLHLQERLLRLAESEMGTKDMGAVIDGQLWRRIRKYNNELSLVVSNCWDTFLNFGDCEDMGLNRLLLQKANPSLPGEVRVMLAPHHGTKTPGSRTKTKFPRAAQIVFQNGKRRFVDGKRKFYQSKSGAVLETYDPNSVAKFIPHHFPAL